jgi:hypothetical protein
MSSPKKRKDVWIPHDYYNILMMLSQLTTPMGYYGTYKLVMDQIIEALWDQAHGRHQVIGCFGHRVVLEKTDTEYGNYWTQDAGRKLSDKLGLITLWDKRTVG